MISDAMEFLTYLIYIKRVLVVLGIVVPILGNPAYASSVVKYRCSRPSVAGSRFLADYTFGDFEFRIDLRIFENPGP